MAKNDGMDALGALVGLGVLGSILEGVSDADMVRKVTASGRALPLHRNSSRGKQQPRQKGQRLQRKSMIPILQQGSMKFRRLNC